MADRDDILESTVAQVRRSAKYRDVCEPLIRRIAATELAKGVAEKTVIKATKRRLHQVAGAYIAAKPHYARWMAQLRAARHENDEELRCQLRDVMTCHVSTKERLPFMERFYEAVLADCGSVTRVLDLACGMNPLAAPWMGLPLGTRYVAVDVCGALTAFVQQVLEVLGLDGAATACDITDTESIPTERFDVAFLLKGIPCLTHLSASCPREIISAVNARELIVSFPAKSLGGNEKGMRTHYERVLEDLLCDTQWPVRKFEFPNETAFRISKMDGADKSGASAKAPLTRYSIGM